MTAHDIGEFLAERFHRGCNLGCEQEHCSKANGGLRGGEGRAKGGGFGGIELGKDQQDVNVRRWTQPAFSATAVKNDGREIGSKGGFRLRNKRLNTPPDGFRKIGQGFVGGGQGHA